MTESWLWDSQIAVFFKKCVWLPFAVAQSWLWGSLVVVTEKCLLSEQYFLNNSTNNKSVILSKCCVKSLLLVTVITFWGKLLVEILFQVTQSHEVTLNKSKSALLICLIHQEGCCIYFMLFYGNHVKLQKGYYFSETTFIDTFITFQLTFTCSESVRKTLKQGVKSVQARRFLGRDLQPPWLKINNKDTRTMKLMFCSCLYC